MKGELSQPLASRFAGKSVCVTGGAGFLGSFVVEKLRAIGIDDLFVPRSRDFDLTRESDVIRLFREHRPKVVFHLAAVVGGIGANRANPGSYFYKNLMMGALLMEFARLHEVEKFVGVGTICSYPKHCPIPFRENDLWNGYPEETNAPYGIAKKALLVQAQAYRQQYGFNAIHLLPVNLYGPRDNFNPETSHVIPALVRKCVEAVERGDRELPVWGTGRATREFLYVEDAARAVVLAAAGYDGPEPVNLGCGQEISIRELAEKIAELTGFRGTLKFDPSSPDGQPRRCLDTSRARALFGFSAETPLNRGLQQTLKWFREHRGLQPAGKGTNGRGVH